MEILFTIIKAGQGDALLISLQDRYGKVNNILIDGGNKKHEYNTNLRKELEYLNADNDDNLLIITHIDQDHIKGIEYLFRDIENGEFPYNLFAECWFNSSSKIKEYAREEMNLDISQSDMIKIERYLNNAPIVWEKAVIAPRTINIFNSKIRILSPDFRNAKRFYDLYPVLDISEEGNDYDFSIEELGNIEYNNWLKKDEDLDKSRTNASSIAFLLTYGSKDYLLLGDAIPDVIDEQLDSIIKERGLNKLSVELVKLSHHCCRKSMSYRFLDIVDCQRFIVSANGSKANLPNKSNIAKILTHPQRDKSKPILFYFNYEAVIDKLKITEAEYIEFNFRCLGPNYQYGNII